MLLLISEAFPRALTLSLHERRPYNTIDVPANSHVPLISDLSNHTDTTHPSCEYSTSPTRHEVEDATGRSWSTRRDAMRIESAVHQLCMALDYDWMAGRRSQLCDDDDVAATEASPRPSGFSALDPTNGARKVHGRDIVAE